MERPIGYDKLAREDRFVRMRAREVAQLKVDQGFPPFADLSTRDSMRERVHGIMEGEIQAMEGAGSSENVVRRRLRGITRDEPSPPDRCPLCHLNAPQHLRHLYATRRH